jgi:hypothetical protein
LKFLECFWASICGVVFSLDFVSILNEIQSNSYP